MELTNDFEVKVPIDQAWKILTDLERIAPCMPGAQLQEVEGDEYRGVVKVKVGPITAQYKGKATFQEMDEANHVAVLKADGRDSRGQGDANALITARLTAAGDVTQVSVHTDLTVTGKVAQFGRSVMADVSAKLMGQFVDNLETMILAGDGDTSDAAAEAEAGEPAEQVENAHVVEAAEEETTPAAVTSPTQDEAPSKEPAAAPVSEGVRRIDQAAAEPVDLLATAGAPVAKRLVPTVVAVVVLLLIWRWLSGRDRT